MNDKLKKIIRKVRGNFDPANWYNPAFKYAPDDLAYINKDAIVYILGQLIVGESFYVTKEVFTQTLEALLDVIDADTNFKTGEDLKTVSILSLGELRTKLKGGAKAITKEDDITLISVGALLPPLLEALNTKVDKQSTGTTRTTRQQYNSFGELEIFSYDNITGIGFKAKFKPDGIIVSDWDNNTGTATDYTQSEPGSLTSKKYVDEQIAAALSKIGD